MGGEAGLCVRGFVRGCLKTHPVGGYPTWHLPDVATNVNNQVKLVYVLMLITSVLKR